MNNLSVYFWVTPPGLNQGLAVMFFHKRGLSGEASQQRTAVPAVCPVELSPRLQPEARRRVRRCHPSQLAHGRIWSLMTSNFLTFPNTLIVVTNVRHASFTCQSQQWINTRESMATFQRDIDWASSPASPLTQESRNHHAHSRLWGLLNSCRKSLFFYIKPREIDWLILFIEHAKTKQNAFELLTKLNIGSVVVAVA